MCFRANELAATTGRRTRILAPIVMSIFATIAVWVLAIDAVFGVEPISLGGFRDGTKHWKNGQNVDGYPAYRPEQVREIAESLLRYQRANGGWPKDFDPLRILTESEARELAEARAKEDTSFDNRATYPEVEYLALAYKRLGDERYRDASLRGIEFILKAQYPNGGWPHTYPSRKNYYPRITIVDDVMVGVLSAVRNIAKQGEPYDFVPEGLRRRVNDALERGDACLLKLQVRVDGDLTGWASQYDEVTLQPCGGRTFEPAGLTSAESVGVLKYLMHLDAPSPAVRQAIESGTAWLQRSKIEHLRIERVPAETVRFQHHTSRFDLVAVEDPAAPPLWARFYEIETNRPFMANRDGKKVYRLADVERERRTGYSWYGPYAKGLLESDYPTWRKRWPPIVDSVDRVQTSVHSRVTDRSTRLPTATPTHANVKYGPHDRNLMDVWLAKSDRPTPVLISIHGGAFRHGEKSVNDGVLRECLACGISVVAITYRFSDQAIAPAQFFDSARAVQLIRHQSKAWNLDPTRIAATGGSAGAGLSLWLGFHDDLADPDNEDPVLRQSTRLTCMAVNNGQTSYDPRFIRDLFPGSDTYQNSALAELFDVDLRKLDDLPAAKYKLFEEVSAINFLTKDDAPVLMTYDSDLNTPISSRSIGIHHPRFGKVLKEKMDLLGIECQVHTGFARTKKSRSNLVLEFVKKHFRVNGN